MQDGIQKIRLYRNVVFGNGQPRHLLDNIRDELTRASQVLENETDRCCAVMRGMHIRNRDATTSLTAKHSVVFNDALGNVSLADRSSYNCAAVPSRDFLNRAGG